MPSHGGVLSDIGQQLKLNNERAPLLQGQIQSAASQYGSQLRQAEEQLGQAKTLLKQGTSSMESGLLPTMTEADKEQVGQAKALLKRGASEMESGLLSAMTETDKPVLWVYNDAPCGPIIRLSRIRWIEKGRSIFETVCERAILLINFIFMIVALVHSGMTAFKAYEAGLPRKTVAMNAIYMLMEDSKAIWMIYVWYWLEGYITR
jgi:hypothetical protein